MSRKSILVGVAVILAAVGFLVFRPDKLFVDDVVDEGLEEAFADVADPPGPATTTTVPSTTESPATTSGAVATTTPTTVPPDTTTPEGPVQVSVGSFFGIDHSASGTAGIYREGDRHVLRFEDDTDIQNGPDLFVWLTADDDWYHPGEHIDLGKLKGNIGGQNYVVPDEFDPEIHRHVLIWCLRFTVPFAAAEMG